MEKSKKSINVEGGFFFKINKRDSTIIREMRVKAKHYWPGCPNDPKSRIQCHQKPFNAELDIYTGLGMFNVVCI